MSIIEPATMQMIKNIIDGTTPPERAIADEDGKSFKDYYALKSELSSTVIETTITDLNSLPKETGIYKNETGFTTNVPMSSANPPYIVNQEVYTALYASVGVVLVVQKCASSTGTLYQRVGYYWGGTTPNLNATLSWGGGWKIIATSTNIYATNLNNVTVGSSSEPVYFNMGTPIKCTLPYTNENLLINPDFKINQRGGTTYTYSGTASYTVDRWAFDSASYTNSTLTPNTGSGMTLYNALSSVYIVQYIETPLELSTQYTISANSPTGTVKAIFTTPSALPTSTTNYVQLLVSESSGTTVGQLNVRYHATKGYWCVRIDTRAGETLTLNWVKLEKGAIATPFVAPDITTELLKCQRYFIKFSGNGTFVGTGFSSSTTVSFVQVALAVPTMIQKPTVEMSGCYLVSANHLVSGSLSASYYGNTSFNQNVVKFEVSATGLTKGEHNMLQIRSSSGYLSLDAEI